MLENGFGDTLRLRPVSIGFKLVVDSFSNLAMKRINKFSGAEVKFPPMRAVQKLQLA